jgi:DNA-binding CsgD family transcriptional regulator
MAGKRRKIDFKVNETGCYVCTSHYNSDRGYMLIHFNNTPKYIHRFIYEECFGEIQKGLVVRHKCDNRRCINPEHLELGTIADNSRDMVERDRSLRGSLNKKSKLSEMQVKQIIELSQTMGTMELAKKFNINRNTVWRIKAGRGWKHVL